MAITAKFQADFTSFQDAVSKAEVSLKSFESDAGKVSTALNKMADSFSGRKIAQDAELATKAVNEIGGATKLTQQEQAQLNAQLTVALEKYKVLGVQAPDGMVKLKTETQAAADALKKTTEQSNSIIGSLGKLAGAVGIGFSVGSVVSFGKSVFDSASKIHDLAEQIGISAEAVQGFKFAAEQSGSSLDAVGTAITKMNKNLAVGEDSTIAALKSAGLSFQDIRKLSPEQAFLAIADAIQKVPNPMKQSELALTLFGKSAAELLPGIKEGFRSAAEGASKMSNDTINALEAAQDAWDKLGNEVVIVTGTMISSTINATKSIVGSFSGFAQFVSNSAKFGIGAAVAMADLTTVAQQAPPVFDKNTKSLGETTEAQKRAAEAAKKYAEAVKELNAAITPLTEAQKFSVVQLDKAGASADQIGKVLKISGTAVQNYLDSLDNMVAVTRSASAANDAMVESAHKLTADFVANANKAREATALLGAEDQSKQLQALVEFSRKIDAIGKDTTQRELQRIELARRTEIDSLNSRSTVRGALYDQAKAKIDQFYNYERDVAIGTADTIADRMRAKGILPTADLEKAAAEAKRDFEQVRDSGIFSAEQIQQAWLRYYKAEKAARGDWVVSFGKDLDKIANAFAQLAQVTGGEFGSVVKDIANVVESLHLATTAAQQYGEALTKAGKAAALVSGAAAVGQATGSGSTASRVLGGAATGAAIGSAFGPVGTAIGAVGGALTGLFRGIAGLTDYQKRVREAAAETKKLQDSLIATHGGMDKLVGDANRVGINIKEALTWKNDPQALQNVITDLDNKLQKMAEGLKTFGQGAAERVDAFFHAFDEARKLKADDTLNATQKDIEKSFLNSLGGTVDEVQAEFKRIGLYAGTAFAQSLRENGWQQALKDAGPMFDQLNQLTDEFGFHLDGAAAMFAGFFQAAKDNADVLQVLDSLTQMIKGAGDALFIDQDLMSAFGEDAIAQFTKLTERGVDANQALTFMQPTLQALWEAQQKFGLTVDDATQALIDQAETQGIVGENMRSVNEQMLDVLKGIAKVLGADIPDAAQKAGKGIDDAFKNKSYTIPIKYEPQNDFPGTSGTPDVTVRIPVELDGSTLAEVVARQVLT